MKKLRVIIAIIAITLLAGNANAGWVCYQKMVMTEEVTMQASSNDTGSSMYTSDGYLKSSRQSNGRARIDGRAVTIGNSNYQSGSNTNYQRISVPHYYTVCEDNGRVVSVIEHN